ncbi:MAG TPA: TRAP transporter small permease [Desulfobacteraceae bacterium]|nr:TRAP transporter small permease [Desulfobacteraceae bacterium]HPJ68051.1 TRAP transporter small permease [Desulfobacteraceae bacterium]HPQ28392.1 TRAP transporter small permease [Desulfobacteraceae bacterium]
MKKIFNIVCNTEELVVGYVLLVLAFVATFQVVTRYVFGLAYDWFEEWARYLTVLVTFMGAGLGVKYGTHFSMEAVTQYAPDWLAHLFKTVANLTASVSMAIVCWFSWVQIGKLMKYKALTPATEMPMWIAYLPIGIFSVVISFRFLMVSIRHARSIFCREEYNRGRE